MAGAQGLLAAFGQGAAFGQVLQLLVGVAHFHEFLGALANGLLERFFDLVLDDEHHGLEAGALGVVERVVHDDLAAGTHRVDLLEAAVTAAHTGRQHH